VKIAILGLRAIGPSASGGIEKAIEELSTRFVRSGHHVTVFCRARYSEANSSSYQGVRIQTLPAIYTKHLEAISNTVAAISCTLRGYDVIHINAIGPALLSFVPRLFGRKVVVTVHGLDWKREKWGTPAKLVLRLGAWASATFPNRTVVVSQTLAAHYRETYDKAVTYIPNGVTLPEPAKSELLGPLGLKNDDYVLFLSRLVPEKGCHTLIDAFRRLETGKKLVIVGAPSHSEEYAASLRRLADGDPRILFTGALHGSAKDAAYRGAYCFVLPSTIEGMPLVLLEAMSYGKCCLCSDIEENLEVIAPSGHESRRDIDHPSNRTGSVLGGPFGLSFRTGDASHLREQLAFMLDRTDLVSELGEKARTHVANAFNWDRIALEYLRVYHEVAV